MIGPEIQIALIGAGRWGALHAKKLEKLDGARLVAVVDPNIGKASALAEHYPDCTAYDDLASCPAEIHAASVTTPAAALFDVGQRALLSGYDVFLEKPVATTAEEAGVLARLAAREDRVAVAGLVERFNPSLDGFVPPVSHLMMKRWGRTLPKPCGIGLDWAVHDLDLAGWLCEGELQVLQAREGPQHFWTRLLTTQGVQVEIDVRAGVASDRREVRADDTTYDLLCPGGDALADELAAFIHAVRTRDTGRLATMDDAHRSLALLAEGRRSAEVAA